MAQNQHGEKKKTIRFKGPFSFARNFGGLEGLKKKIWPSDMEEGEWASNSARDVPRESATQPSHPTAHHNQLGMEGSYPLTLQNRERGQKEGKVKAGCDSV